MVSLLTGRRTAWLVALVPLLLAGALIGLLGEGERDAGPTDSLPRGADSTLATELRDQLPAEDASVAIVLYTADEGQLSRADLRTLHRQAAASGRRCGWSRREDGTAALAVVPVESTTATENADKVTELRDTAPRRPARRA